MRHVQQFRRGSCCKTPPAVLLLVVFFIRFHGTAAAAAAVGLISSCPLRAICALSLSLPVAFLSDARTTKVMIVCRPQGHWVLRVVIGIENRLQRVIGIENRLQCACWFSTCRRAGGRRTTSR